MTCLLWWHSHFATAATGHDCMSRWRWTLVLVRCRDFFGLQHSHSAWGRTSAVRVRTVLCLRSITSGQNQTKTKNLLCHCSKYKILSQKTKNNKKNNTASDLLEYKNLQGWFEFGERDEQKLCKLIKWPLRGPWLLPGRQSPIWMCNDAKWLVSDSIRVCQVPRQIMSCLAPLSEFCTRPQRVQNYFEPGEQSVKLISKSGTFRFVVMCLDTWRYTAW